MEAPEVEMCGASLDHQQEGLELLENSPFGDISGFDDLWEDEISSATATSSSMDPKLWSTLSHILLELIFARLPLHCIVQLRMLSKHWHSAIASPDFQHALRDTKNNPRNDVAVVMENWRAKPKRVWVFDACKSSSSTETTSRRRWYGLPLQYLPFSDPVPVAADGGLLCFAKLGLHMNMNASAGPQLLVQVVVCNPLTQSWRELPRLHGVHAMPAVFLMVVDSESRQYSIFCKENLTATEPRHFYVYSSNANTWVRCLSHTNKWERCLPNTDTWERCLRPQNSCADGRYILLDCNRGFLHTWDLQPGVSISNLVPRLHEFRNGVHQDQGFFPARANDGRLVFVLDLDSGAVLELQTLTLRWREFCHHPRPDQLQCYYWRVFACRNVLMVLGERKDLFTGATYNEEADELKLVDRTDMNLMLMYDMCTKTWSDVSDSRFEPGCLSSFIFEPNFDSRP